MTEEHIRDKIAASKKKGVWMGGVVPLGRPVEAESCLSTRRDTPRSKAVGGRCGARGKVDNDVGPEAWTAEASQISVCSKQWRASLTTCLAPARIDVARHMRRLCQSAS